MNAIDYSLGLKLQDYSKPLSCKIKDFLKDIVTYLTTIFMMLLLLSSGTIYPCSRKKSLDYCKSKDNSPKESSVSVLYDLEDSLR